MNNTMTRRIFRSTLLVGVVVLLAALTLLAAAVVPAYAVDSSKSYLFELSIDGGDTKHAAAGDIVTVLLTLKRTDKDEGYTMYAMQDEICYDPAFFELVQGSAMSAAAIETTDISLRGGLRAFYMNFVSFGGGEDWNASTMIGTFQLKVIGTSGSSVIRNTENLVSTADGMDSYAAEARDVTVVVTDDCTVKFESNGGSFVPEQVVKRGQYVTRPEDPTREGFVLEGWYTDFDMTRPWDFDRDTVTASMTLYARWTDGTAIAPVDENGGGQVPVWVWIALGALLLLLALMSWLQPWGYNRALTMFSGIQWGMIGAVPLLLLYNGERGAGMKWFFYIYYPVHTWLLALINRIYA